MSLCESIQHRLTENGIAIVDSDIDVRQHVRRCPACSQVYEDLRRLDEALQGLSEFDATDSLVTETLNAIRKADSPTDSTARPRIRRARVAGALAASVVVIASFTVTFSVLGPSQRTAILGTEIASSKDELGIAGNFSLGKNRIATGPVAQHAPSTEVRRQLSPPVSVTAQSDFNDSATPSRGAAARNSERETFKTQTRGKLKENNELRARRETERSFFEQGADSYAAAQDPDDRDQSELALIAQLQERPLEVARLDNAPAESKRLAGQGGGYRVGEKRDQDDQRQSASRANRIADIAPEKSEALRKPISDDAERGTLEAPTLGLGNQRSSDAPADKETDALRPLLREYKTQPDGRAQDEARAIAGAQDKNSAIGLSASAAPTGDRAGTPAEGQALVGGLVRSEETIASSTGAKDNRQAARDFLQSYRSTQSVPLRSASGYWANTYIPGDPAMRLVRARLGSWNRAALGPGGRLEQTVTPVHQPFDAPGNAAMAIYMDTDSPGISGPTRLRVQIGLKGAERQGGRRPAMNIGLVIDLRTAPNAETGARIRALIAALETARQPEDRFSLTVAGPAGGLLVMPDRFRHGPLRVAIERMFDEPQEAASGAINLPDALALAGASVRERDGANSVLGSSLLLLVTASSLASDLGALERMAHRNAVAGLALSVVSLAGKNDLAHIDRVVAAGQGSRSVLDSTQAVDALVDRELHAASRAVARALRLRIRLAAGVKLIDVLGSHPLGAPGAARVREAEQAIDRRLARSLGIHADRGEDEEGIQIVIPHFYAGDTHVILLDVLAERAGPIADVTLRYKDTVYLRNGITRANLSVYGHRDAAAAIQGNVTKNLVAFEFARRIRAVSRDLAHGNYRNAARRLASTRGLIQGLRLEVPGWLNDPNLIADEALLGSYLAVLETPAAADAVQHSLLADSLHYAAFRKLQPSTP